MELLYIRLTAPVASFRYPFIVTGRQPSYPLPPLSTIYGLLCAAWGSEFEQEELRVGYIFYSEPETVDDIEKLWLLKKRSDKPPSAKSRSLSPIEEMKSNVFRRELRINVALELYLKASKDLLEEWREAFRNPYFWLTLGRSQELVSIEEISWIFPEEKPAELAGPGLYPLSWQSYIRGAYNTEKMPVYIPLQTRRPIFHGFFVQLFTPQPLAPTLFSEGKPILTDFVVVPTKASRMHTISSNLRVVYLWPLGKSAIRDSVFLNV